MLRVTASWRVARSQIEGKLAAAVGDDCGETVRIIMDSSVGTRFEQHLNDAIASFGMPDSLGVSNGMETRPGLIPICRDAENHVWRVEIAWRGKCVVDTGELSFIDDCFKHLDVRLTRDDQSTLGTLYRRSGDDATTDRRVTVVTR